MRGMGYWAIVLAWVASGCGGAAGDRPTGASVVRDSAGIRIVESDESQPLWDEDTAWRLAAVPSVDIGVIEGDSVYQFFDARSAIRLRDGSIGVLDAGTAEVRVFGIDGAHLRSFGRQGEGPGEFRQPWRLFELPGDSILVFDLLRGLFAFDRAGVFGRQSPLDTGARGVPEGALSDGSILLLGSPLQMNPDTAGWLDANVFRVGPEGDSLGVVRVVQQQYLDVETRSPSSVSPRASLAAGDSSIWYSRGDSIVLEEIDASGMTVQFARLRTDPRPLTESHREGWTREFLAANGPSASVMLEMFSWPENKLPLGAIEVDAERNVWVSEQILWGAPEPIRAHVFRPDGVYMGAVALPHGASLQEIGEDFVLTIEEDELGVQRVRLYELLKPGG